MSILSSYLKTPVEELPSVNPDVNGTPSNDRAIETG